MSATETDAQKVVRLSEEAVANALREEEADEQEERRDEGSQRRFTITKFSRHKDGYLHANLSANGRTIYVHRRFGSWMAPGTFNGKAVLKEVLREPAGALQVKARALEKRERSVVRCDTDVANDSNDQGGQDARNDADQETG